MRRGRLREGMNSFSTTSPAPTQKRAVDSLAALALRQTPEPQRTHQRAFLRAASQATSMRREISFPPSPAHGLQPPIGGLPSPFATPRVRARCEVARRHNVRRRGAFEARHRPAAGSARRSEWTRALTITHRGDGWLVPMKVLTDGEEARRHGRPPDPTD
jgi:hypothetical protein